MINDVAAVNAERESVKHRVLEALNDMTSDWDLDPSVAVGEETMLVADLAFESIDVVHLIVTLGEMYEEKDLGFERLLIEDDRYVTDLRVSQLLDFLYQTLKAQGKL